MRFTMLDNESNVTDLDIYADENRPRVKGPTKMTRYYIQIPDRSQVYASITVYEDGLVELDKFKWFGIRGPKEGGYRLSDPHDLKIWNARSDILEWLAEWELIELKPIGPEDKEYFATEQLERWAVKAGE